MIYPTFEREEKILREGASLLVGVDEAGRGPLAGPVVAGAAWVDLDFLKKEDFALKKFIRDSKTVPEKRREELFDFFQQDKAFEMGIGQVEPLVIDQVNILRASHLAMRFAVDQLAEKIKDRWNEKVAILVDGNLQISYIKNRQYLFSKGDRDVFSIAVASICAKVHRDRLMREYEKCYPGYGFEIHKGYGTQVHMKALAELGPCKIHRKSFAPVAKSLRDSLEER